VLLVGFGPVGRAFAQVVARQRALLSDRGLDLRITAIATSKVLWRAADGRADPDGVAAVAEAAARAPFDSMPGVERGWNGLRAIEHVGADLLVEASPTNLTDGEPATSHLRLALSKGISAAVAGKGALVHHLPELRATASRSGARLRFGAATAAALPTLDLVEFGLAGAQIERVDGVLNGTSNHILTAMRRDGLDFAAALRDAQARGIAEADPTLDVDGWDTAAKLVLLGNHAWSTDLRLADVERRGIRDVTPADLAAAAAGGRTLRLLGSLWREEDGRPRARVAPVALEPDHPMAHVDGAEKGATFVTDTLGRITVSGGASSPVGAAAALLRDVIHLSH